SGKMNTAIIISNQGYGDGSTYAARICNELQITEGGKTYGDWYLPSKQELNLMYLNKATIDSTAIANGGVALDISYDAFYWSSTENNSNDAWRQSFDSGALQFSFDKNNVINVRAIRAF
ncbi:MAG: DUF1566 domain-containing protein, partial [Calditrichales bacterium]|nr:DUF1566 domain-containing protein [Calditrichales bacterium]